MEQKNALREGTEIVMETTRIISWDTTREIPFSKLSFEAEMSDKQTELDTETLLSHPRERPKVTVKHNQNKSLGYHYELFLGQRLPK